MNLIDFLSILFKCNDFSGIQKAVVDQSNSQPPNSDDDFFWWKFGLEKCFGASYQSNHWRAIVSCCIKSVFVTHHNPIKKWFLVVVAQNEKTSLQNDDILYFWSVHEAPLKLFHFSNLLQMPNNYRMVSVEFLGKFLGSCKRISFNDCSQSFMVNFWWPATGLLICAKIFVQNFLNHLQKFLNLSKNS